MSQRAYVYVVMRPESVNGCIDFGLPAGVALTKEDAVAMCHTPCDMVIEMEVGVQYEKRRVSRYWHPLCEIDRERAEKQDARFEEEVRAEQGQELAAAGVAGE